MIFEMFVYILHELCKLDVELKNRSIWNSEDRYATGEEKLLAQ